MEQWIVFDARGVIFKVGDDTNALLVPFVQKLNDGFSREFINELYIEASLGRITSEQFWGKLGFAEQYPDIEREYLDTMLRIDKDFKGIAEKIAKTYRLALLSNDVREWSIYLRKRHELNFFNAIVISGDVGYRKPERKIYEIFLEVAQTGANRCVFIDDRCKNLRIAKELGGQTIRFMREYEKSDFSPDAEIDSFKKLEEAIEKVS